MDKRLRKQRSTSVQKPPTDDDSRDNILKHDIWFVVTYYDEIYYETVCYYITEKYVLIDTCELIFILIVCRLYQEFEMFSFYQRRIYLMVRITKIFIFIKVLKYVS